MELPITLKRSSVIRKAFALAAQVPRIFFRAVATRGDYERVPPIFVNSFPKSGTHLLLQIVNSIPHFVNYGSFIASTPSITFRERSKNQHIRLLNRIVPGEIIPAHLFFNREYEKILSSINCVHFFIHRDLRDVAISEAYYLTYMNRWHRLHRYYKRLPNQNARISQAILGINDPELPFAYPNIAQRFNRYSGWLSSGKVFSVRFEELNGQDRFETIKKMIIFCFQQNDIQNEISRYIDIAQKSIDPQKSHTFHNGKSGQWKTEFTNEHHNQFRQVKEELSMDIGYDY